MTRSGSRRSTPFPTEAMLNTHRLTEAYQARRRLPGYVVGPSANSGVSSALRDGWFPFLMRPVPDDNPDELLIGDSGIYPIGFTLSEMGRIYWAVKTWRVVSTLPDATDTVTTKPIFHTSFGSNIVTPGPWPDNVRQPDAMLTVGLIPSYLLSEVNGSSGMFGVYNVIPFHQGKYWPQFATQRSGYYGDPEDGDSWTASSQGKDDFPEAVGALKILGRETPIYGENCEGDVTWTPEDFW